MKRLLVLAAAVVLVPLAAPGVATAGGGCHGNYVPDAKSVDVTLSELCMDPMVTRIPVSGTVTWTNKDSVNHNVIGAAFQWASDRDINRDEFVSFRFDSNGTYPYACTIHPGMLGAVVVGTGVTPAGAAPRGASVTQVALGHRSSAPAAEPTVDPATAESSAEVAAPAPQTPPSAKPEAIAATPVSSRSEDNSGVIMAGFALVGALLLAGIAFLARRTPPAQRELIG